MKTMTKLIPRSTKIPVINTEEELKIQLVHAEGRIYQGVVEAAYRVQATNCDRVLKLLADNLYVTPIKGNRIADCREMLTPGDIGTVFVVVRAIPRELESDKGMQWTKEHKFRNAIYIHLSQEIYPIYLGSLWSDSETFPVVSVHTLNGYIASWLACLENKTAFVRTVNTKYLN